MEILIEVQKLSPVEKEQVLQALKQSENNLDGLTANQQQAELFKRLKAKGILRSVRKRRATPGDFEPIRIKGKPLSQTIIEERR